MYRIGVDVGGTNTDAVVMVGRDILAAVKVTTSSDVTTGLMQALREAQKQAAIAPADVALVVIGTTHFTNAVIERRHLSETAVVRLCLPAAQCLLPMVDWPAELRSAIGDHVFLASGGVEISGLSTRQRVSVWPEPHSQRSAQRSARSPDPRGSRGAFHARDDRAKSRAPGAAPSLPPRP